MEIYKYGNQAASVSLIQLVGDHDVSDVEGEIEKIREISPVDFGFTAVKVDCWNDDLSPWYAPAVFGNEDFGGGAAKTLKKVLELCEDTNKKYYIGGYSLAGLFSLWAFFQTDIFSGVAAVSPSVWFPGFTDYMKTGFKSEAGFESKVGLERNLYFKEKSDLKGKSVYLSLGDREEKTKNPVMCKVGDCIRETYDLFCKQGISCTLEWNEGNHFREPALRTARGFGWLLKTGF